RRLGYHGATVEQIAAALQMKKGNLYYYFTNKEEILFACHQYSLDQLMRILREVQQSGLAADEKLRRLGHPVVHTSLVELQRAALFLELEALTPAHLKAVIVRRDEFDHGVRAVLEEGMASGAFARGNEKLLGFALLGAVNWIPRWFNPAGAASSHEIADLFADFFIGRLRRGSGVSRPCGPGKCPASAGPSASDLIATGRRRSRGAGSAGSSRSPSSATRTRTPPTAAACRRRAACGRTAAAPWQAPATAARPLSRPRRPSSSSARRDLRGRSPRIRGPSRGI